MILMKIKNEYTLLYLNTLHSTLYVCNYHTNIIMVLSATYLTFQ